MIVINKEEAFMLRKRFPEIHITITSRNTNHKRYFAPEEPKIMSYIHRLRNPQPVQRQFNNGGRK